MSTKELMKLIGSLKEVERTFPQTCPYCLSEDVEITIYDFSENKPFFADIWVCSNRECGELFIAKTVRKQGRHKP